MGNEYDGYVKEFGHELDSDSVAESDSDSDTFEDVVHVFRHDSSGLVTSGLSANFCWGLELQSVTRVFTISAI